MRDYDETEAKIRGHYRHVALLHLRTAKDSISRFGLMAAVISIAGVAFAGMCVVLFPLGAILDLKLTLTRSLSRIRSGRLSVSTPPGAVAARFGLLVLGKRAKEARIDPIIADMQYEVFEALSAGAVWQARIASLRGHAAIVCHFLQSIPIVNLIGAAIKLSRRISG